MLYVTSTLYVSSKNYWGVIKRKLDHNFTSNIFYESVKNGDILASFSSNHFRVSLALKKRYCDFKRQKATGNSIVDYYQRINLNRCENLSF